MFNNPFRQEKDKNSSVIFMLNISVSVTLLAYNEIDEMDKLYILKLFTCFIFIYYR